jgi:formylglycine-generating enzyme required for sulfatase activity
VETEKTPLRYKGKAIEEGYVSGFTVGNDLFKYRKRAYTAMWATYFTQLVLPMVQISGDVNHNFTDALINFDKVTNKPISENPVYIIAKYIVDNGVGLRVNDFMKLRSYAFEEPLYKDDLYLNIMGVFANAFSGETNTSKTLLYEIETKTGSKDFVEQLKKVTSLFYRQITPPDLIKRFKGMNRPIQDFTETIFSTPPVGADFYYFNEKEETSSGDNDGEEKEPYPTNQDVCAQEKCLCDNYSGFNSSGYLIKNIPGCMVYIPAKDMNFAMGSNDKDAYIMEKPMHRVDMQKSFLLDKYEVTVAQFKKFLNDKNNKLWLPENAMKPDLENGNNKCIGNAKYLEEWRDPSYAAGEYQSGAKDLFPVTSICWYAAKAYCEWAGKRLPYENEWEFAARADSKCLCNKGDSACISSSKACRELPWGDSFFNSVEMSFKANFRNSYDPNEPSRLFKEKLSKDTLAKMFPVPNVTPVGIYNGGVYNGVSGESYQTKDGASPFGIYDMSGNAEEWSATRFYYYSEYSSVGMVLAWYRPMNY